MGITFVGARLDARVNLRGAEYSRSLHFFMSGQHLGEEAHLGILDVPAWFGGTHSEHLAIEFIPVSVGRGIVERIACSFFPQLQSTVTTQ